VRWGSSVNECGQTYCFNFLQIYLDDVFVTGILRIKNNFKISRISASSRLFCHGRGIPDRVRMFYKQGLAHLRLSTGKNDKWNHCFHWDLWLRKKDKNVCTEFFTFSAKSEKWYTEHLMPCLLFSEMVFYKHTVHIKGKVRSIQVFWKEEINTFWERWLLVLNISVQLARSPITARNQPLWTLFCQQAKPPDFSRSRPIFCVLV